MKNAVSFILANKKSFLVLGIHLAVSLVITLFYPQAQRPSYARVIAWDTFGYYLYLPSTFIYHDLFHLGFIPGLMKKYYLTSYFYQAHTVANGNYVMSYPLGLALLYTPFFFVGHLAAKVFGYPMDGFSEPYLYSILVGGIFYASVGVVFTIRNLRFFFSDKITAFLLLILLFATNYFYYTVFENAMSHNYSFAITSLVIYLTIKWHAKPQLWTAFLIGFLIGLATIVRPSEILISLIPLLWGVYSRQSIQAKIQLIKTNYSHLCFLVAGAVCIPAAQLFYWKMASGNFLYYSYGNLGFNFLHPNILNGLFSFRKGWFVYTPVMVLALLGIPLLWRNKRSIFFSVFIFTAAIIYITFSWQVWWYGGSFGQRAMIPSYALLVIPMGFLLQTVSVSRLLKWLIFSFVLFCIFLNCFQTWQYLNGFWSTEGPTPFGYKLTFLKTHLNRNDVREFLSLEYLNGKVTDSVAVFKTDFSKQSGNHFCREKFFSDSASIVFKQDNGDMSLFDSVLNDLKFDYLRIDAKAMFDSQEYSEERMLGLSVNIKDASGKLLKHETMLLQPLIGNDTIDNEAKMLGVAGVWDDVYMYIKLPEAESVNVSVQAKNPGGNQVYIDDFKISLLKTKK